MSSVSGTRGELFQLAASSFDSVGVEEAGVSLNVGEGFVGF